MNYRHAFHAGNFADVGKHVIVGGLLAALQRKPKGLLILDTHAGRGSYDLAMADRGLSLAREPEYPAGIGRLADRADRPPLVESYWQAVQRHRRSGPLGTDLFPGSPWLLAEARRDQDRLVACELHPDEAEGLRIYLPTSRSVVVREENGFTAIKALLPPPERRALVLIDPPYEDEAEPTWVIAAVREGLRRSPAATFAIWYPETERVARSAWIAKLCAEPLPPTWLARWWVAGPKSELSMPGCGMVVINPPWQLDKEIRPTMSWLADAMAQDDRAGARLEWLVEE